MVPGCVETGKHSLTGRLPKRALAFAQRRPCAHADLGVRGESSTGGSRIPAVGIVAGCQIDARLVLRPGYLVGDGLVGGDARLGLGSQDAGGAAIFADETPGPIRHREKKWAAGVSVVLTFLASRCHVDVALIGTSALDSRVDPFLGPVGPTRGAGHSESHFYDGFARCQLGHLTRRHDRNNGDARHVLRERTQAEIVIRVCEALGDGHCLGPLVARFAQTDGRGRDDVAVPVDKAVFCRHDHARVDERAAAALGPYQHDGGRPYAGRRQIAAHDGQCGLRHWNLASVTLAAKRKQGRSCDSEEAFPCSLPATH